MGAEFLHMFWSCLLLTADWVEVTNMVADFSGREVPCTPGHCLLSWFPHTTKPKVPTGIQDLDFTVEKRHITRNWKAPGEPRAATWHRELERRVGYENAVLLREARRGHGSLDMARAWEALEECMMDPDPTSQVLSTGTALGMTPS
ncbi:hypothetical protein NDU88_005793 [Pleurodeles waltl]|uniref:Uncharacterized protein n=1 Tax=Pleurodeles waltl TaxID=8319 RepID=A0AAV7TCB8_PLEWA|nr:hypothetical protein NDU88_005793 [Pleurodeles waltl]